MSTAFRDLYRVLLPADAVEQEKILRPADRPVGRAEFSFLILNTLGRYEA